jgi:retron-type reverse transcriptase
MNPGEQAAAGTNDPYLAVHNIGLLQRQAGVDPEVAELVSAYARMRVDAGKPLNFYDEAASTRRLSRNYMYRRLIQQNRDVDPRFLSFLIRYGNTLAGRRLPVIYSVDHLAAKRRMSETRLHWMAHNQKRFYTEFRIPKSNGESRTILSPNGALRAQQEWILRRILNKRTSHPCAFGFVPGRSIVDNARRHTGREVVVRIDLKDFFPTITHREVRKVFERLGYPYRVANLLANLCTVDGKLPQGAPTSPSLSNLVCQKLDRRFAGLRKKLKFRYTRYADDLVFSSNNPKLPSLIPFFKEVIQDEGFEVNDTKIHVMRKGQRQKVTGVVVNRKPNVSREQRRLLRAAMHRLKTQGPDAVVLKSRKPDPPSPFGLRRTSADPVAVLRGHLSFLNMVRRRESLNAKA